jgi:hypothetical protein
VDLDALQGEREIGGDGLAHDGSFGPPAAGPATRGRAGLRRNRADCRRRRCCGSRRPCA